MPTTLLGTTVRNVSSIDAWSPSVLFAQGEPGTWYDPSDVSVNWRRNLLIYTEQFDNAAWTKINSSITANVAVSPDGTNTADKFIPSLTGGLMIQGSAKTAEVITYTFTLYAKASELSVARLYLHGNSNGNRGEASFDLINVTTSLVASFGTFSNTSASIISVGNGWCRCILTTTTNSDTGLSSVVRFDGAVGGTDGFFVWGAQVEVGALTDYQQIVTPEITYLASVQPQPILYTTSDGTTPVTAVEQAVGLILDKSRGLALGPELVTNGDFSDGTTGWGDTRGATLSVTGGVLSVTPDGILFGCAARQIITTVAGRSYRVTYSAVAAIGNPRVGVRDGTSDFGGGTVLYDIDPTPLGNRTFYFTAISASSSLLFGQTDNTVTSVAQYDNISVREIAGTYAIQPGSTSRMVLRNRYNLLTYSEGLTNAAYSVVRSTIAATTAVSPPSGVATIFKLTEDSTASNTHFFLSTANTTVISGQSYRTTIVARAAERSWIALQEGQGVTATAYFNLATGAIGTISGTGSPSAAIADLGGGWYRCTLNWTALGTAGRIRVFVATGDGTASYTGDGTSGVYLSATEIRPSIDTIYPYQRIEAATVYDSTQTEFPLYLAVDGSDDGAYTAANLDLTSTDKVSLFAGVTKLSDAADAILLELSADWGANAGSFLISQQGGVPNYIVAVAGGNNARSFVTYTAPVTNVLSAEATTVAANSAAAISFRADGNLNAGTSLSSNATTGNFGSYPLYIGRRNNTNFPFNGRIYQLIVRGAASSAAEISNTERWIAGKMGRSVP